MCVCASGESICCCHRPNCAACMFGLGDFTWIADCAYSCVWIIYDVLRHTKVHNLSVSRISWWKFASISMTNDQRANKAWAKMVLMYAILSYWFKTSMRLRWWYTIYQEPLFFSRVQFIETTIGGVRTARVRVQWDPIFSDMLSHFLRKLYIVCKMLPAPLT